MDKRFIEESFPVKEVSEESAYEKHINKGHISTSHIWWARRPLACSRATNYASLIPKPQNISEWNKKRNFITELCKWKNSLNANILNKAKKDILDAFNQKKPKVLDPFAGGGAIPLEALRLGCETYASDYNPIAVLIEKCILEYPQKYKQKLVNDLKKWIEWIYKEVKKEIEIFYPIEKNETKGYFSDVIEELIPNYYIWARTVKCQNPLCEGEIPLLRQFWLSKKKEISLYPYIEKNKIKFKIVGTGYEKIPNNFDPSKGIISKAIITCPICGSIIEAKVTRKLFQQNKSHQKLIAVVLKGKNKRGKLYRIANEQDSTAYDNAERYLEKKRQLLRDKWLIEPIPDEDLPPKNTLGFRVQRYNILKWGDLFNSRQKLVLISFIEKNRNLYEELIRNKIDEDYSKALVSIIGLLLGRLANWNSVLCRWRSDQERNESVFSRQALPMVWDYAERNPLIGTLMKSQTIGEVIAHCSKINTKVKKVIQCSATELPYEDNYFDAVFTDPPYYDNIPYSYLSDFFYVWLKRCLGDLYPELFSTLLTPKTKEIVAYSHNQSLEDAITFFENMLSKSFKEINRTLKPNGIAIIVYAHKTTKGWEAVINALINSGLSVTASWPINTEMKGRLRAQNSAALASSVYIIARKIEKKETGFYPEIKNHLNKYLNKKLEKLWQEGISGADFYISAIGAGLEIFSNYEKIIDYEGNTINTKKWLEDIRKITTDFAVKQILHNGFSGEISSLTRFYILWRWNYQERRLEFDEAKKLAHSVGINLEKEWNKGFIKKSGGFITVIGPKHRKIENLKDSVELIDILHYVLLQWERGRREKITEILSQIYSDSELFFRITQAISQSLPNESKEKKLIDGFLSGKERIKESIKESKSQDKIDRWTK